MKPIICTAVVLLFFPFSIGAEIRTWKDASGKFEVRAELVGVTGEQASLKRQDGQIIQVPIASLSAESQLFLKGGSGTPSGPSIPGKTWEKLSEPERQGWSLEKIKAARDYASTLNTEAVMIVAGGKVLDEWGATDQQFNVHSIRKSFLSALYGMRVQEGLIKMDSTMAELGIDDNEPSLTEEEKRATVADLLKARSGVYHPALYETAKMKAARPQRHSHNPGEFWYYNNWDFNALGTIYEQKSGKGIFADFKTRIAEPIGMEDFREEDGTYETGADSIHRAYPFRMTARDMARFGLLFLRGGQWAGKQIVPAEWVKESTQSYSSARSNGGYGYLWWIASEGKHLPGIVLPEGSYSAQGAGGHYILVIPPLDLVIVHRVNTDISGRRVESLEIGELVRLILAAHQSSPAGK